MSLTQNIQLDLNGKWSGQCVTVTQGDNGWLTINATITNDGAAPDLDGYDCYFVARLPNKATYQRKKAVYYAGTASVFMIENQFAALAGFTDEAAFQFIKGDVIVTTGYFALDIRRDLTSGQLSERYDSLIDGALSAASKATSDANAAAGAANTAAGKANAAADRVDASINAASDAAEKANTSASKADSSASAATKAASSANNAASSASYAADNANKSASSADAAASSADAAAKRANAAADSLLFEVKPYRDGYALYQIIG